MEPKKTRQNRLMLAVIWVFALSIFGLVLYWKYQINAPGEVEASVSESEISR